MRAGSKIYCTVTNDLTFDQRMIRICTSLSAQYEVTLVGRQLKTSVSLKNRPFRQKRLNCLFNRGWLFYAEYNLRLLLFLLFKRMDVVCAIDLDTIVPCYLVSSIKRIRRVYDAHELFCEMKEVSTRPFIHYCWKTIEKYAVPKFRNGYTVNSLIADEFMEMYGVQYGVIRNLPLLRDTLAPEKTEKYILYQGAVNEGRSFETLIPAMKLVAAPLRICGDGNFLLQARQLVQENGVGHKVTFEGMKLPDDLLQYTAGAWVGVTLFENCGRSNYLSLSNRFFDYMHAGIPQICVNYPLYSELNNECPFALLVDDLRAETIAAALNRLLTDDVLYATLRQNCLQMRWKLNWQTEEKQLIEFYKNL